MSDVATTRNRIPLFVLTGFLGSGKTTLLRQVLAQPEMADTAVVINELGEIGLDHYLVQGATESMLVLENGCVCCNARDDLVGVLSDLFWNRLHRKIPRFSRVILETTGIARPGPIIEAVFANALIAERFELAGIVTTVDATQGRQQLASHNEAVEQVIAADMLLITKVDLVAAVDELELELAALNSAASRERISHGGGNSERFFTPSAYQRADMLSRLSQADHAHDHGTSHLAEVHSFSLFLDAPVDSAVLLSALTAVTTAHPADVLRIKGVATVADDTRQMVVQVVGTSVSPLQPVRFEPPIVPAYLVFITRNLDPDTVVRDLKRHLLEARRQAPDAALINTN